jgi:hypothetical protein
VAAEFADYIGAGMKPKYVRGEATTRVASWMKKSKFETAKKRAKRSICNILDTIAARPECVRSPSIPSQAASEPSVATSGPPAGKVSKWPESKAAKLRRVLAGPKPTTAPKAPSVASFKTINVLAKLRAKQPATMVDKDSTAKSPQQGMATSAQPAPTGINVGAFKALSAIKKFQGAKSPTTTDADRETKSPEEEPATQIQPTIKMPQKEPATQEQPTITLPQKEPATQEQPTITLPQKETATQEEPTIKSPQEEPATHEQPTIKSPQELATHEQPIIKLPQQKPEKPAKSTVKSRQHKPSTSAKPREKSQPHKPTTSTKPIIKSLQQAPEVKVKPTIVELGAAHSTSVEKVVPPQSLALRLLQEKLQASKAAEESFKASEELESRVESLKTIVFHKQPLKTISDGPLGQEDSGSEKSDLQDDSKKVESTVGEYREHTPIGAKSTSDAISAAKRKSKTKFECVQLQLVSPPMTPETKHKPKEKTERVQKQPLHPGQPSEAKSYTKPMPGVHYEKPAEADILKQVQQWDTIRKTRVETRPVKRKSMEVRTELAETTEATHMASMFESVMKVNKAGRSVRIEDRVKTDKADSQERQYSGLRLETTEPMTIPHDVIRAGHLVQYCRSMKEAKDMTRVLPTVGATGTATRQRTSTTRRTPEGTKSSEASLSIDALNQRPQRASVRRAQKRDALNERVAMDLDLKGKFSESKVTGSLTTTSDPDRARAESQQRFDLQRSEQKLVLEKIPTDRDLKVKPSLGKVSGPLATPSATTRARAESHQQLYPQTSSQKLVLEKSKTQWATAMMPKSLLLHVTDTRQKKKSLNVLLDEMQGMHSKKTRYSCTKEKRAGISPSPVVLSYGTQDTLERKMEIAEEERQREADRLKSSQNLSPSPKLSKASSSPTKLRRERLVSPTTKKHGKLEEVEVLNKKIDAWAQKTGQTSDGKTQAKRALQLRAKYFDQWKTKVAAKKATRKPPGPLAGSSASKFLTVTPAVAKGSESYRSQSNVFQQTSTLAPPTPARTSTTHTLSRILMLSVADIKRFRLKKGERTEDEKLQDAESLMATLPNKDQGVFNLMSESKSWSTVCTNILWEYLLIGRRLAYFLEVSDYQDFAQQVAQAYITLYHEVTISHFISSRAKAANFFFRFYYYYFLFVCLLLFFAFSFCLFISFFYLYLFI